MVEAHPGPNSISVGQTIRERQRTNRLAYGPGKVVETHPRANLVGQPNPLGLEAGGSAGL